jgi:hypothetical protein
MRTPPCAGGASRHFGGIASKTGAILSVIRRIRQALRPIRRMVETVHTRLVEMPYLLRRPAVGTPEWLIRSEVRYGGYVTDVPRERISPLDGRKAEQLTFGGMTGGDRMLHHAYAPVYSRYLKSFFQTKDLTLAEFGILRGTGLAIWCDLFPTARVIGLDIDISHFEGNRVNLEKRGAFRHNRPEIFEFDQLVTGRHYLESILKDSKFNIVVDDGLHSKESIMTTWRSVEPFLAERFVYLIEDFEDLINECGQEFVAYDCRAFGQITAVSRGIPID